MKRRYIDHYGVDSLPHLKEASMMGAQGFLTTNKEILNEKKELEKKFNIKILRPEEVL